LETGRRFGSALVEAVARGTAFRFADLAHRAAVKSNDKANEDR